MDQQRIEEVGKSLLEYGNSSFSGLNVKNWSQALLDKMMTNENFRVAALRFTDVAPTLRNDEEFMDHLGSYFGEVGNLKGFIGTSIPGSGFLGRVVAPLVRRNIKGMAHTFIAGETVADSIHTFKKLHKNNLACAIDLLGEAVISEKEATDFTESYKKTIVEIAKATKSWNSPQYPEQDRIGEIARANVSIKLSALYEHVNVTAHNSTVTALCERFRAILNIAMEHGVYVHVDTEQYSLLPITLDVFETVLMEEKYRDYPHVGIVCQAYLKDSEALLHHLIRFAKKRETPFSIRLVKGAYWDYEQAMSEQNNWPCPVFSIKEDTDANYEKLIDILIKSYPIIRPCIGSHNARSLAVAIECMRHYNLQIADVEFQMLYGMADNFRNALRSMGYRVRQYCPIGEFIPGMSYLVRRLLENTANQSFLRMHGKQEANIATLLKEPLFDNARVETTNTEFLNHPLKDFSIEEERINAEKAIEKYNFKTPATVMPYISGKKVNTKESIMVNCPWQNEKTISEVKLATIKDAEKAIASSKEAFHSWRDMGAKERCKILKKAAKIAENRWAELLATQVYEASKDIEHADADIAEGIDFINYYAEQAVEIQSKFQPKSKWGELNSIIYEPRGVCAVIAPWNFPFAISAGMTSAALAAGNSVIYKPAEQTSYTGQLLTEIYIEAGVPKGVFNFLPGKGSEVGAFLVEHKDISVIAFTGSKDVGLKIYNSASVVQSGQKHLKKCVIEMGGKNALIIDSDADLDEAVPAAVHSAFGFQGQKCSACSRVIVIGSAYEPFIKRIKEMVESLKVGAPTNPANDINAVIDIEAYRKINSYIDIGKEDGDLLATTDKKLENGHFIAPHVFINLKKGSKLTTDEVFGPVLSVYKADTIEQAVTMAMDSEYALTGGAFSRNPKTLDYIKQHFKVGNLYINRGTTGALVNRQPFGGGALSGTGTKAGGADYLLNFMEARVITENSMRRGFAPKEEA